MRTCSEGYKHHHRYRARARLLHFASSALHQGIQKLFEIAFQRSHDQLQLGKSLHLQLHARATDKVRAYECEEKIKVECYDYARTFGQKSLVLGKWPLVRSR